MTRNLKIILIASIVVCLFLGYAAGRGYKTYEVNMSEKMKNMNHSNMSSGSMDHSHNEKEIVSPNVYAPKIVELKANKDTMSGYNINLSTQNFRFTPEMAGAEVIQNTGHAHVYVNDVKVGRMYSNWYHIPQTFFQNGTNTISVTLNANNHNSWWSKKGTLEARQNLDIFIQN